MSVDTSAIGCMAVYQPKFLFPKIQPLSVSRVFVRSNGKKSTKALC